MSSRSGREYGTAGFPPFAAVRAFEASARHMSVKAAANELCLTLSAVSHQIKAARGVP